MEMQVLVYGADWNETFGCCSYNWALAKSDCVQLLQPMKAKLIEGEEAKKSKAAKRKHMMFMEFLNLVLKLQLL